MHKIIYGECQIALIIEADSLLLVQGEKRHQSGHQVTTFFNPRHPPTQRNTLCLPASSLKGAWRSGVERILRSFDASLACDPFSGTSCSRRLEGQAGAAVYSKQCPACRIFGSTAHAGLIRIEDAWWEAGGQEQKTAIAVDRITGGVRPGALYAIRPTTSGSRFTTTVTLSNFDLWQVGTLALIWREMNEGALLLGSGGRKGMGEVSVTPTEVSIRYPRRFYTNSHADSGLYSARYLAGETTPKPDDNKLLPDLRPDRQHHWRDSRWVAFTLQDQQISEFFKGCVENALAPRLQQGRDGFDYQEEVTDAADLQKSL